MNGLANAIALVIFAISPVEDVAHDRVDLMEVNHFYDEQGRLVFDQVIFYDWNQGAERHQVRAWRLVKNPNQIPTRNWVKGGYTAVWQDGELLRSVQSHCMRETWTQYDPELVEREYLPKEQRKELTTRKIEVPQPIVVVAQNPTFEVNPDAEAVE